MNRNIFLVFIISISVISNAQSIKRGFKNLEKKEYEKAKETFSKLLAEDSAHVATNFGMAIIKADEASPYFDIVDSYQYIVKVKGNEGSLTQDEIDILFDYFMNTEVRKTNRPVKKKLEIAEEAIDARLIKFIREENNLEAVYKVLEMYPDYKHYDNVVHIRNQFEYRKYEKTNTLAAYKEFIEKFPDAAQVSKAKNHLNRLAFEEIKSSNSIDAINAYINNHPDSRYLQQAIRLRNAIAFQEAEKINTLEAYNKFIESYPDALEISKAKKHQHQLMYEKAKRIKSLEAYNDFIKMYPNGLYYLDVFNLKASDLGMKNYQGLGFTTSDLQFSRCFDNDLNLEDAVSIAETKDKGLVVAGNTRKSDTSYSDAWVVKLDSKGDMLWNKTVGLAYNDIVKDIHVTSTGDYIVVGYTQATSDSGTYMGWMFKLSTDGQRVWNKSLGKLKITSSEISAQDKIYMAYYIEDTIPDNYSVQAFNVDGNKVWERDYVRQGSFSEILFCSNNDVFLAGNRWFTLADSKFYLKWEDTLSVPGVIKAAGTNSQIFVLVASDSLNNYIIGYNNLGKKTWMNTMSISGPDDQVHSVLVNKDNSTVIAGKRSDGNYLIRYDGSGKKISDMLFAGEYRPVNSINTSDGRIVYLFTGLDFLVTVFSSYGF
jgi:hypothetical protein